MKVDGIRIYWEHSNRSTVCHIQDDESNKNIVFGLSIASKEDHFSYEEGRKRSLRKAMNHSFNTYCTLRGMDSRKTRTKVWEAFRTLTKIPKWTQKLKIE